ncbi:metal-dependent phosphohydrolase [Desertifilum sp. FACHB-1129]|uniref:Metal-dependent phosphohydrolase n=1 Tax=Desertifilum tharense IPPAS B-1220 TaxID=1781255 RepID=A0A1E5QQ96_9CYAN|nr:MULTISPECIES: Npun_R2479 family HD domain-containing metalloprotein [Desertifilum]MDA0209193.1 metal-dependent phosphohydrolase [Cyanobacteria bacterium FC1]MDI9639123.1 metal-dependent phosphohydrolase [Geitlerinema splendidum]MDK3157304.1 metal-dependent phosphohydrolase [Kamptonema cortianum]MBD2311847.1 metal-dependent phosphohydrolase [Desertifilum sp. FACHB-1129]MBD2322991.1 metal-dependent phosphohydrolase [Desertifilum sp. FACHB-866]
MFNATEILIDAFVQKLKEGYRRTYGGWKTDYEDIIGWAGSMALENIANSDALYHNVEHTILVGLVGQEILRGKHIREGGVSCEDWLHYIISLVCHDIGYVKGVCRQDRNGMYATGKDGAMVSLPPGSSDAGLTPYHVDRAKLFIGERFGGHKLIDAEIIKRNIELTRFPVPKADDRQDTAHYPGLVRAADLIGQLSDPRYLKKITSLFYEFEETGVNQLLGYRHPGDLRKNYAKFFWDGVHPYVKDALHYLSLTQQGKQIIANLYSNVFVVEHEQPEPEADVKMQLAESLA